MRRRAELLLLCLCALSGCDDGESAAADRPDAVDSEGPTCSASRRTPSGECCAAGAFYAVSLDACVAIGPEVCAASVLDQPEACTPRWCGDWRDESDGSCAAGAHGCALIARACTADELAAGEGCPAGSWPDPDADGACTPRDSHHERTSTPPPITHPTHDHRQNRRKSALRPC